MKAVRFHETGGPEVLRYEDVETPTACLLYTSDAADDTLNV